MRWWPRTVRWKMLLGLVLLEALSIGLFALVLIRIQSRDVRRHVEERLASQVTSIAAQSKEAFFANRQDWLALAVRIMGNAPSVAEAKVTDQAGNILVISPGQASRSALAPAERAQMQPISGAGPRFFRFGNDQWEGVEPIYIDSQLNGYAWVRTDRDWDREQLLLVVRGTFLFGVIWILSSSALVWLISRSISRPLAVLHRGASALMRSPESIEGFPLPMTGNNEFGDLIETFNRMVASIEEQRSGLNDTLSLLESMLANAPIGLAFFDRRCRCVRVNHVFAAMTGFPLSRHLGKTLPELVPEPIGRQLEDAVGRVFSTESPERDVEIEGSGGNPRRPFTWLASTYPIRTTQNQMRRAGLILQDISERKQSEETLRKTEKLAATGRLAASIAHEVNNPLEAITNLLYLLRNFCDLDESAMKYVTMAEREGRRIADIAQQTLRFYRQSTQPHRASMTELLDTVLDLFESRCHTLNIRLERDYDPETDLFCYAGEIRQVIANFVGNAIDATSAGGRLVVRARRSRSWKFPEVRGVRFTVADTGSGMGRDVRERVFDAFFTTKEETGTGLGLWVSHEIILKHRGLVHIRSRAAGQGQTSGTVFEIFLPDNESPVSASPASSALTRQDL
ncbi:MAG TPA: ATP-binding protein [Terracidiphilus sp.]|nr:ATP-binding protein [Terracidiphilus sp.]